MLRVAANLLALAAGTILKPVELTQFNGLVLYDLQMYYRDVQHDWQTYYRGVQHNSMPLMPNAIVHYEKPYSHVTTAGDLDSITESAELVLLGAKRKGAADLFLWAVAPRHCALQETAINQPHSCNGAWWYRTPSVSVGFSSVKHIIQQRVDVDSQVGDDRLSWHLDCCSHHGGWRAGAHTGLNDSEDWIKVIWYWLPAEKLVPLVAKLASFPQGEFNAEATSDKMYGTVLGASFQIASLGGVRCELLCGDKSEMSLGVLAQNGHVEVIENGSIVGHYGDIGPSHSVDILVNNHGTVEYRVNGQIRYTSDFGLLSPVQLRIRGSGHGPLLSGLTWHLHPDIEQNAEADEIGGNDSFPMQQVEFIKVNGLVLETVPEKAGRVSKLASFESGQFNAVAFSDKFQESVTGIGFKALDTKAIFRCDLLCGDLQETNFTAMLDQGRFLVVENGSEVGHYGSFGSNDTVEIALSKRGTMEYKINGQVRYTSGLSLEHPVTAVVRGSSHGPLLANLSWHAPNLAAEAASLAKDHWEMPSSNVGKMSALYRHIAQLLFKEQAKSQESPALTAKHSAEAARVEAEKTASQLSAKLEQALAERDAAAASQRAAEETLRQYESEAAAAIAARDFLRSQLQAAQATGVCEGAATHGSVEQQRREQLAKMQESMLDRFDSPDVKLPEAADAAFAWNVWAVVFVFLLEHVALLCVCIKCRQADNGIAEPLDAEAGIANEQDVEDSIAEPRDTEASIPETRKPWPSTLQWSSDHPAGGRAHHVRIECAGAIAIDVHEHFNGIAVRVALSGPADETAEICQKFDYDPEIYGYVELTQDECAYSNGVLLLKLKPRPPKMTRILHRDPVGQPLGMARALPEIHFMAGVDTDESASAVSSQWMAPSHEGVLDETEVGSRTAPDAHSNAMSAPAAVKSRELQY